MFGLFEVMFFLVFAMVFGTFIITFARGISQWNKNNKSPRLTVDATVVSKRGNTTTHHHNHNGHHHHTYHDTYYATFQFESGDRIELQMAGHEFGLIVEGDKGKLTFQGTRFLGFERVW